MQPDRNIPSTPTDTKISVEETTILSRFSERSRRASDTEDAASYILFMAL